MNEEQIRQYNNYIEYLKKEIDDKTIIIDHIPTIEEYYPNLNLKGEE